MDFMLFYICIQTFHRMYGGQKLPQKGIEKCIGQNVYRSCS